MVSHLMRSYRFVIAGLPTQSVMPVMPVMPATIPYLGPGIQSCIGSVDPAIVQYTTIVLLLRRRNKGF